MRNKEAIAILENDVMVVVGNFRDITLPATNGVVNEDLVSFAKKDALTNTVMHLVGDLVTCKKHYPKKNTVDVDLETEFAVIKLDDLSKLINLLYE